MQVTNANLQNLAQLREQQTQIRALAARDREVRAHEQAHASVGGAYAGAPHYDYVKGPNGIRYASSGHVDIDASPVPGDPAATIDKLTQVARAALAPARPSAQDRSVAAEAKAGVAQARAELSKEQADALAEVNDSISTNNFGTVASSNAFSTAGGIIDLIV